MIGSHAAEYYAKKGNEVIVLDNLMRSTLFSSKKESVEYNWNYLGQFKNVLRIKGDVRKKEETIARGLGDLAIRAPSPASPVQTLSGGNQQRVVLAKWLATSPRILILDGPTVGIDVAAKSSIHEIIRELAGRGMGIVIISDEVPEVLHTCNRILVMRQGSIAAEFEAEKTSEEEIQQSINEHEEAAAVS